MFVVDTKTAYFIKMGFKALGYLKWDRAWKLRLVKLAFGSWIKSSGYFGATQRVVDDDGPDPQEAMGPNGGCVDGWRDAESL